MASPEKITFHEPRTLTHYGKKYFNVEYKGANYRVRLFPFQETQPEPKEIHCLVSVDEAKKVHIVQDLQPYLEESYSSGCDYEFVVRRAYADKHYYEVEDRYGLYFRLNTDRVLLERQVVTCRVENIRDGRLKLELLSGTSPSEDSASPFNEQTLAAALIHELGDQRPTAWDVDELARLVIANNAYSERMAGKWVRKVLRQLTSKPDLASDIELCDDYAQMERVLREIRDAIRNVLESTTVLNDCGEQRGIFQERLTTLTEQCSFYHSAVEYIAVGRHIKVIDSLFSHLEISHYVYHAAEKLEVMMCIFNLLPDLMEQRMGKFFDIVTSAEEHYWKTDTFRRAFIRLLDFYISELYDEVANTTDVKRPDFCNVFKALAIQLLLADPARDADLYDAQLSYARLYRMAACFSTGSPDYLLRRSVLSLSDAMAISAASCFSWDQVNQLSLIASRLSEQVTEEDLPDYNKNYLTDRIRLIADSSGLSVAPLRCESKQAVLPPAIMLWDRLQFFTEKKLNWPNAALKSLPEAHRLWNELERELESRHSTIEQLRQVRRKERPERGDEVRIAPYAIDPENPNRLLCRIDDDYYEGEGLLPGGNLAPYNVKYLNGINPFRGPNGEQLCVIALIEGITPDGRYIFSTKNVLQEDLKEIAKFGEQLNCLVVSHANGGWVGFAENGLGVFFENADEFNQCLCDNWGEDSGKVYGRPLIGKVVCVTLLGAAEPGLVPVEIVDIVDYVHLDQVNAVANWARHFGEGPDEQEAPTEEEEVFVANSLFTAEQLDELMLVLNHVAMSEENLLRRFHYVSAVRLLAKLTGREQLIAFYDKWRELLGMLNFYAINHRIDEVHAEQIQQYRADSSKADGHLLEDLDVLYVLSRIGHADEENRLLDCTHQGASQLVRELAAMVMAANLLSRDSFSQTHKDILERIDELLHITREGQEKKSIGREGIKTEFKTSLVFPPNNGMKPDIEKQTHNVLRTLSAFFNTQGGTLYLGVNDHGIPVGIDNDLAYNKFSNIATKDPYDEYERYIRVAVRVAFGPDHTSDDILQIERREMEGKKVFEVKVLHPHVELTRWEGKIFERQGSENVLLEGELLADFEKRRSQRLYEQENEHRALAHPEEVEAAGAEHESAASTSSPELPTPVAEPRTASATDALAEAPAFRIATDTLRNNALTDDEEEYIVPVRFLTFFEDNTAQLTSDYYGMQPGELLTLAIHENEQKAWLILGYADGSLVRIPLRNLLDKTDYQELKRAANQPLVFATIAQESDALFTLTADTRGGYAMRLDSVNRLPQGTSLQSVGECLIKDGFERIVNWEVLPEQILPSIKNLERRKSLLDSAEDGVGCSFVCNESNRYYTALRNLSIDPARNIPAGH